MSEPKFKVITNSSESSLLAEIRRSQWFPSFGFDHFVESGKIGAQNCKTVYPTTSVALVQEPGPNGEPIEILSSCGLYQRPSVIKIKGSKPIETISHTIIAVVTPLKHRGKGYAAKLLTHATKFIDDEQARLASESNCKAPFGFSHLFSDVGDYYSKFGYKRINSDELYIDLSGSDEAKSFQAPRGLKWLMPEDFDSLAETDREQFLQDIDKLTEQDGITRVAITPSPEYFRFYESSSVYSSTIKFPDQYPNIDSKIPATYEQFKNAGKEKFRFGAKYGPVSALWSIDFRKSNVSVYRTFLDNESRKIAEAGTPEQLSKLKNQVLDAYVVLLKAAMLEGEPWKMEHLSLWKGDLVSTGSLTIQLKEVVEAFNKAGTSKAVLRTRDLMVPMIRYTQKLDDVEWFEPGQYSWH